MFGVSRQSVHAGVSQEADYFRVPHLLTIVEHATRSDSEQLRSIIQYIEAEYAPRNITPIRDRDERHREVLRELLSPRRRTLRRLRFAFRTSIHIVVFCNYGRVHLRERALFAAALTQILSTKSDVLDIVAPRADWLKYLNSPIHKMPAGVHLYQSAHQIVPSPVVVGVSEREPRGFIFGQTAVEEIEPEDAHRMILFAHELGVPRRAVLHSGKPADELNLDQMEFKPAKVPEPSFPTAP